MLKLDESLLIWEIWETFGKILESFEKILENFVKIWENFLENFKNSAIFNKNFKQKVKKY